MTLGPRARAVAAAALLVTAAAAEGRAQGQPAGGTTMFSGTAVRLATRSGVVWRGELRSGGQPDALVVALPGSSDSTVAIPLDAIVRAERAATETERLRIRRMGLGIGLLSGLVGGALIGAMIPVERPQCESGSLCFDFSGLDKIANVGGGLLLGGLAGAGIGTAVGHARAANAWRPVALPVRVAVAPVRGAGVSLAVSANWR